MNIEDILWLDYRKKENKDKIRSILCKIGPLKKYKDNTEEIPLNKIEKAIGIICRKYEVQIQWITPSFLDDEVNMYSLSVKETINHKWLVTITSHTLYELFAKTLIYLYDLTKKNKLIVKVKKEE